MHGCCVKVIVRAYDERHVLIHQPGAQLMTSASTDAVRSDTDTHRTLAATDETSVLTFLRLDAAVPILTRTRARARTRARTRTRTRSSCTAPHLRSDARTRGTRSNVTQTADGSSSFIRGGGASAASARHTCGGRGLRERLPSSQPPSSRSLRHLVSDTLTHTQTRC